MFKHFKNIEKCLSEYEEAIKKCYKEPETIEEKEALNVEFGLDIVNMIEGQIQNLATSYWSDDGCPPEFWISLNNEDMKNQSIMITINHLGCKFTEKLFPRTNTEYGYDSVLNQMINMYNRTM